MPPSLDRSAFTSHQLWSSLPRDMQKAYWFDFQSLKSLCHCVRLFSSQCIEFQKSTACFGCQGSWRSDWQEATYFHERSTGDHWRCENSGCGFDSDARRGKFERCGEIDCFRNWRTSSSSRLDACNVRRSVQEQALGNDVKTEKDLTNLPEVSWKSWRCV